MLQRPVNILLVLVFYLSVEFMPGHHIHDLSKSNSVFQVLT